MKKLNQLILVGLVATGNAFAQPTDIGNLELSITDKYKAKVSEANMYLDFPSFKDTTTEKILVKYQIFSDPVDIQFRPKSLPPLRIKNLKLDKLPRGLVRFGYGLYNTPLAEIYYNTGRSSKYNFGFGARHYSTQNGVEGRVYENNAISNNQFNAHLNRFYKNLAWNTNATAQFDKVSYYGVDRVPLGEVVQEDLDPNSNWYRQFGIQSQLLSTNGKSMAWLQKLGLSYYNLTDDYSTMENNLQLTSRIDIPVIEEMINTDVNLSYFRTDYDSISKFSQSFLTLQFHPKITTTKNDWSFDFGLNLYYNSAFKSTEPEINGNIYFFPEVIVRYPVVKDVLITYLGLEGKLIQNSVKSLVNDNPYLNPGQELKPSRNMDLFIGMNGILSSSTSFNLKGGFMSTEDRALFYRNPFYYFDSIQPGIDVLYDKVDRYYVRGELSLNIKNNLQINLNGELNSYITTNIDEAWHLPAFTGGLNSVYTLKKKIKLRADLDYIGERTAFAAQDNLDVPNILDGYIDLGLGIEYLYNSRISAFISANNLLNSDFDYYLGYRTQNVNVLFGLSYQF